MTCSYDIDGVCTNAMCPLCTDGCPVPDTPDVCKFEDRELEVYSFTPNGCALAAFMHAGIDVTSDQFKKFWDEFSRLMEREGYIREE